MPHDVLLLQEFGLLASPLISLRRGLGVCPRFLPVDKRLSLIFSIPGSLGLIYLVVLISGWSQSSQ